MRDNQNVTDMVEEVLLRSRKARAARTGEFVGEALEAILDPEVGQQLRELGSGWHRREGGGRVASESCPGASRRAWLAFSSRRSLEPIRG